MVFRGLKLISTLTFITSFLLLLLHLICCTFPDIMKRMLSVLHPFFFSNKYTFKALSIPLSWNINNLRYADDTTLTAESKVELKSLLMKVKEESEKVVLKLNIQKMIMASGSITSWEIDGETVETVSDFIFLGSKITADGDWSHEIKRRSLLRRKVMTNLDSILKSRDITLPTKVRLVKAMVFPVVVYGCESWTVKKAEHWRIDAFELWCWKRLLRVPWTARRSNHSILKEISPGCLLGGLMLKLKLQYFLAISCEELTHWKSLWCWEGLGAGGKGDDRGWDGWMASLTWWMWVWVNSGSWWWTGSLACCDSWGCKKLDTTEWLNWTDICIYIYRHTYIFTHTH